MKTIGKYQIAEEIGRSAAGVTCRARDGFRNRDYVLKILSPLAAVSAASKEQLYRDLAVAWDMVHPNIARIQDVGEVESIVYIASEMLAGRTLAGFMASEVPPMWEKLALMAQVCEALACAHSRGIAHGNLKPANIFVTEERKAVVLDFGTGSWQSLLLSSGVRLNGLVPNYLAPEQILGEAFDRPSDIFSTGVVLYEILTGAYPFQAAPGVIPREIVHAQPPSLRHWNAQIPEELEQIVFRALKKDPRERFQSADEFAANLQAVAECLRREPLAPSAPPMESVPAPELNAPVVGQVPAASADVVAQQTPEPASVQSAPVAETAAEPVLQTTPYVEMVAAPASYTAPPPMTPIPPQQPAVTPAPVPAAPVRPRPSPAKTSKAGKRRLVTFAMGGVIALSMVGVIVVRQNLAAPGNNRPHAIATPAPKPVQPPAVPQAVKPAPFVEHAAAPPQTSQQPAPADAASEQILRGQVRQLWEAGQYAEAMRLVDEVLTNHPENAEARGWKRRIRAAQDAEAAIK